MRTDVWGVDLAAAEQNQMIVEFHYAIGDRVKFVEMHLVEKLNRDGTVLVRDRRHCDGDGQGGDDRGGSESC